MSEMEKEVTTELVKMNKRGEIKAKIVPLAHHTEEDIDIALETGADSVLISTNNNPYTLEKIYDISPEDAIKRLTRVTDYAKKNGLDRAKPVFELLNGQVTYDNIRVVLACLRNQA